MTASFPDYAQEKARTDQPEQIDASARLTDGPPRGFTISKTGMYWRDISKVSVDFDTHSLGYDIYRNSHEPIQGTIELDEASLKPMVNLCNTLWRQSKDNEEKPGDAVGHGIRTMTALLLADGDARRYIHFSTKPLKEFTELYSLVWKLIPQEAREAH